jgi:chloramphenicol 3-O phosphotransferase
MEKGNIIFLNGVSSSGKSTLAEVLTKALPDYFHLSVDDFDLVIEKMEDRPTRLIPVPTEYFFDRMVAMLSDRGVNLIVDTVLHDRFSEEDCFAVLRYYPILLVGVHCSPEELRRREMARGDRLVGQGSGQLAFVHRNEIYDVEVDTSKVSPDACAARIVAAVIGGVAANGWRRTEDKYYQGNQSGV